MIEKSSRVMERYSGFDMQGSHSCRVFLFGLSRILMFALASLALPCVPANGAAVNAAATADATPSAMVLVPAGDFLMGSPASATTPAEETPQHKVYVDAFYMDAYEVANENFAAFLNAVSSRKDFEQLRTRWVVVRGDLRDPKKEEWWPTEIDFENGKYKASPGFEKYPVISVSWFSADEYCRWLGKRLPTEAEWERAARGGLEGRDYPWGDALPTDGIIFKRVWTNNYLPAPTGAVGSYHPNGYGLYEMAGNVSEWCSDWYAPDYYRSGPAKNPAGPSSGSFKVVRGGSWASSFQDLRIAFRNWSSPSYLNSGVGFRCVRDVTVK